MILYHPMPMTNLNQVNASSLWDWPGTNGTPWPQTGRLGRPPKQHGPMFLNFTELMLQALPNHPTCDQISTARFPRSLASLTSVHRIVWRCRATFDPSCGVFGLHRLHKVPAPIPNPLLLELGNLFLDVGR